MLQGRHRSGGGGHDAGEASSSPGKRSLTEQLPVQKRAAAAERHGGAAPARATATDLEDPFGLHVEAAARGVAGSGGPLPYLATIQQSFGRHDVGGVRAHTDTAASEAAGAMGAEAYATGHQVAFAGAPTLHTAAHEAAHVVQQRGGVHLAGGVGAEGDVYERHADEVADLVVQGRSAEALLDRHAGSGSGSASPAVAPVQHKLGRGVKAKTKIVRHTHKGDEDHYEIEEAGGTYTIRDTKNGISIPRVSPFDIEWSTPENAVVSRKEWEQERDEADLLIGHNYVSSDYKRINSLLGALEQLGYDTDAVTDPDLDVSEKESELVTRYQDIGIARDFLKPLDRDNWDAKHMYSTLDLFRRMHRVWDKFEHKPVPKRFVYRGDSVHLYGSYKFLDPKNHDKDGEVSLNQTIHWPGVMSTTVNLPRECSLSNGKKIIWKIDVPDNHRGKKLGNNDSESEATFPVGTAITVTKLLVRAKDKTVESDEFGSDAEVIVFATITSVGPPPKDKKVDKGSFLGGSDGPSKPPPMLLPPLDLLGGSKDEGPSKGSSKKLGLHEQMRLELLKKQLVKAQQSQDKGAKGEQERLQGEIDSLEKPDEPPVKELNLGEQVQLGIMKKQLAKLKESKDKKHDEEILELEDKISKLEGGGGKKPVKKPSQHDDDQHGPILTVGETLTAKEDNLAYQVEQIIPGGAHGAWKIRCEKTGESFLWKPAGAVSVNDGGASSELMAEAEVGATGLANFIVGGYLVPRAQKMTFKSQLGTCQPFINVKKETFRPDNLGGKKAAQMVAHMIADWIISNHDNNDTQFMTDIDDNLIGIDKGQAFKHFREGKVESRFVTKAKQEIEKLPKKNEANAGAHEKWESDIEPEHLDPGYHPSGNFKVPSPKPFVDSVLKLDKLPFDWNDESIQAAIHNAEALTVEDVEGFLGDYARRVFKGKEKDFYEAVVARAHRIQDDLELIFKDRYVETKGSGKHLDYKPKLSAPPKPIKPYKGKELDDLGGKTLSKDKERELKPTEEGTRGLEQLLGDFGKFDHKGAKSHDGNLKQHSIYVANSVDFLFECARHPEKFKEREKGDTADMYGDYVKNIPPELRPLLSLTGFLHDAGKGGEAHLHEDELTIGGKHAHPKEGFEMMLPSDKRDPVSSVNSVNKNRTDFDYHLRDDVHDGHSHSASTFDFGSFFDSMKMSPRERAIVQIGTAMHYDFGGIIMKALGDKPEPSQMKGEFDKFLTKLRQVAERTEYGAVDELLVNIVIMIGAADVLGAKQVDVARESQSIHPFPQEKSERSSGFVPFHEHGFKEKGRLLRLALLSYFRTGEVQRFSFDAPKEQDHGKGSGKLDERQEVPQLDETPIAEIDRDGTIRIRVDQKLVTAYMQDLVLTNSYLSDGEGDVLAHYWHVHADVFSIGAASRNGLYREPRSGRTFRRSQLHTLSDGHCLIHGLRLILAGANASPEVVKLARLAIALHLTPEQLELMLTNIVSDHIEGNRANGLRERLRSFLNRNVSVILAKVAKGLQDSLGGGQKSKAKATSSESTQSQTVAKVESKPELGKDKDGGKDKAVVQVDPHDGTLVPSSVFGNGEPIRGALLFLGNHYVLLDEVEAEDGRTPVEHQPEGGREVMFWARLEVALGEAGHDRLRLGRLLLELSREQRQQARELLRGGRTRLGEHAIGLIEDILDGIDEYERTPRILDEHPHGGSGGGSNGPGGSPGGLGQLVDVNA